MCCRQQWRGQDAMLIEARQTRPWWRTALLALPQRTLWRLERSGEALLVRSDFRLFGWGALLIIICYLLTAAGFAFATGTGSGFGSAGKEAKGLVELGVLVLAALTTFWLVLAIGALGGGRRTVALWQEVVARIEQAGGVLAPDGRPVSRRYSIAVLTFAASFLALFSWIVGFGDAQSDGSGWAWVLSLNGALTVLASVMLAAAVLMANRRGFIFRAEAVLGGLVGGVAVLFLLSLPHFYFAIGLQPEMWRHYAEPAALWSVSWIIIGVTFLALLGAMGLMLYGVYFSVFTWLPLGRLQTHRIAAGYRAAVAEGPGLRIFQVVFVTVWAVLALLVLTLQGFVLLCALQALLPALSIPAQRLPTLTADVIATALGRPFGDPWIDLSVRGVWILYGLGVLVLSALSVGQLVAVRRAMRRWLAAAGPEGSRQEALQEVLASLAARAGLGPVRLGVAEGEQPRAAAHAFGWLARERYIEVSKGALEYLGAAELEALLAHELAHHSCGQCRMAVLLRWLGRLTFVGDGFALAIQNSFGYEAMADRMAISFGVTRPALERCLLLLRDLCGEHADGVLPPLAVQLTAAAPSPIVRDLRTLLSGGPDALSPGRRWRLAWWLFRRQYTHAMDLYYWHPTYEERLAALRESRS